MGLITCRIYFDRVLKGSFGFIEFECLQVIQA